MIFILDTHTFLWFITDNSMLSKTALQKIENINHERMISVASLWEIAIKISLGKLELSEAFDDFIPQQLKQNFINILPITTQHLTEVTHLPFHHRDRFVARRTSFFSKNDDTRGRLTRLAQH